MKAAVKPRALRRDITPIEVDMVTSIENAMRICRYAEIIQASTSGLLLVVKREDLVPANLRKNLSLESVHGVKVMIRLSQMDLEISGTIARTKLLGKAGYELAIDYTDDAPEYWRECLVDLLPAPGEFDGH
jgi:hypothetical protein